MAYSLPQFRRHTFSNFQIRLSDIRIHFKYIVLSGVHHHGDGLLVLYMATLYQYFLKKRRFK